MKKSNLKFMKRAKIYKNYSGMVTFNPQTMDAHSYKWWRFVARVEGLVIFNSYQYSNTTRSHQSAVRRLMEELGIKIDLSLQIPGGIEFQSLEQLIVEAEEEICRQFLKDEERKIRTNERARERRELRKKLATVAVTHAAHEGHQEQMQCLRLVVSQ